VDDLKAKLAAQEQELAVKNDEANKLIQVVGAETDKVTNALLRLLICCCVNFCTLGTIILLLSF